MGIPELKLRENERRTSLRRFKSDIPPNVVEQVIREFRREGGAIYWRLTDCVLNGEVVGQRGYGEEGQLVMETPLRNGSTHRTALQLVA